MISFFKRVIEWVKGPEVDHLISRPIDRDIERLIAALEGVKKLKEKVKKEDDKLEVNNQVGAFDTDKFRKTIRIIIEIKNEAKEGTYNYVI